MAQCVQRKWREITHIHLISKNFTFFLSGFDNCGVEAFVYVAINNDIKF